MIPQTKDLKLKCPKETYRLCFGSGNRKKIQGPTKRLIIIIIINKSISSLHGTKPDKKVKMSDP
jgi:hypothetical protein